MRIVKTEDYREMSRKAAGMLAAQVICKPDAVLGLATGETPLGAYKCLIGWHASGDLDFSRVRTFNLDEYKGLSRDDVQGYRYFMEKNLFFGIDVKPENRHIPDGLAADPDVECARYEAAIGQCGGIDMQLLGIGNNGHIGFNEPDAAFSGETRVVDLAENTILANSRFFDRIEDVPAQAFTMGIKTIMRARRIILVASGEHKSRILKEALCGAISPGVPASILQLHGDVTIVGDKAALSLI
jgi:glucosamine-6-phosphate deaminase